MLSLGRHPYLLRRIARPSATASVAVSAVVADTTNVVELTYPTLFFARAHEIVLRVRLACRRRTREENPLNLLHGVFSESIPMDGGARA